MDSEKPPTRRVQGAHARLVEAAVKSGRPALALVITLELALIFVCLLGLTGVVDLVFLGSHWSSFGGPAVIAVGLTTVAFATGFALAVPIGALRAQGPPGFGARTTVRGAGRPGRGVRKALVAGGYVGATGYVEGLRGTPFFVQMWIVFYVAIFTWPTFDYVYLLAGYLALTLNTVAYQAEVFRAGFQSVAQGQIDAARSIGMRRIQVFAHVTLPQGLRLVTLPLVNEWISLFKASAILSFITIQELMFQANHVGSNLGHPIEAFLIVAVVYLAITIPLSRLTSWLEARNRMPGLGLASGR